MSFCIYKYNKKCNHPKVKKIPTFEIEEDCGKCFYRKEATSICDFCKNGDNPNEDDCYGCVAELKE